MSQPFLIIAGSTSALGQALKSKYSQAGWMVKTIGRKAADYEIDLTDYSATSELSELIFKSNTPDMIINCIGTLHNQKHMPERQLSDLDSSWLDSSLEINLKSHINLAKILNEHLTKEKPITWVSLSAMVGSIGDNRLGGWYSYRISKAALNMFIKTLSLEWKRKNKLNKVLSIHPGTTRSSMSAPFKINKDNLYEPELSADRIFDVISNSTSEDNGTFSNWDGKVIPW
ncbi:MAG: SDR family NAD(P)-dependent oxidoreductase [Lentisphaeraceae bacterium]|nr:SDR family NAD(P)-dependent oxidoreductase [Lentisphaeraceae bacterium]